MQDSLIGQTIGGCRITQELRRGGMSTIYLAEQLSLQRQVALKVMSPQLMGDPTFMQRFLREVATTARLQHPHIVPIYDYGEQDGLPYIVMAYIPGGSLEDSLLGGTLPLDTAVHIAEQVAQALDFAHASGVIHRDVKPANILLDAQHNAILTDFGIARVIADTQEITHGALVGTPSYLAPELITEQQEITPAADIYGLGVTVFRMLTGELPFPGQTAVQMMWAHVNEPAPLASSFRPDLPEGIDAVMHKALAKSPGARYESASALASDLVAVARGREPEIAVALPPPAIIAAPVETVQRLEEAVRAVIDQVVKITRPDGGSGSGIYLPGDRVITCLHVADGAPGLYVRFRTGEQIEADMLAGDRTLDLALLGLRATPATLEGARLDALRLDLAEVLQPGEPLAAIGHPLGLNWAVTGGHYNGTRQPGETPLNLFGLSISAPLVQVDVAINPGNSGGPLIDTQGHLVGLADAVINPALGENIGFAIHGSAVSAFWQQHREDSEPLVAFKCGHHHPADKPFCPFTGKPTQPVPPVPMPAPGTLRYSCGHFHPSGTDFCPLTGKRVKVVELPMDETQAPPPVQADEQVTCSNCHQTYSAALGFCPTCGKPGPR
jgi:serine/threonine-protein kinase